MGWVWGLLGLEEGSVRAVRSGVGAGEGSGAISGPAGADELGPSGAETKLWVTSAPRALGEHGLGPEENGFGNAAETVGLGLKLEPKGADWEPAPDGLQNGL